MRPPSGFSRAFGSETGLGGAGYPRQPWRLAQVFVVLVVEKLCPLGHPVLGVGRHGRHGRHVLRSAEEEEGSAPKSMSWML